jgi:hypothetical protein
MALKKAARRLLKVFGFQSIESGQVSGFFKLNSLSYFFFFCTLRQSTFFPPQSTPYMIKRYLCYTLVPATR